MVVGADSDGVLESGIRFLNDVAFGFKSSWKAYT